MNTKLIIFLSNFYNFMSEGSKKPGSEMGEYRRARGLERHGDSGERLKKTTEGGTIGELMAKIKGSLARRDQVAKRKETPVVVEDKDIKKEAADILAQFGEERTKELRKEAQGYLDDFMRRRKEILEIRDVLSDGIIELIREAHQSSEKESVAFWREIAKFEEEVKKTDELIERLAEQNPIAFEAHWLLKLRGYKKSFERTGIIETDAIRDKSEDLMNDVRRKLEGTNGVVALLGPTGSGKTVLAKKIAAEFSPNGEFEFISAHPKMTAEDLVERMGITVSGIDPEKVPEVIRQAQTRYVLEHPDATEAEKTKDLKTIEDIVNGRESQRVLKTEKILEAVGRAAAEGKLVVIDEFNYLPPDTLASINDLLSSGSRAKKGFGVILTGNIGKTYLKRQQLDPAFVNRILSGTVEYSYPPQELDKSLDNAVTSKEDIELGSKPAERDLFQVALTHLLDKKGNLLAPEAALEQVWKLSQVFSLVQKLAEGKDFRSLGLGGTGLQGVSVFKFETVALSFRNLNQVVREWKLDGFTKPLDWYVWQDIVRPASVLSEKEAAQLYYLFHDWGNLMAGDAWAGVSVDSTTWRLSGVESVRSPKRKAETLKPFLPAEVVRAVSGRELPDFSVSEEADIGRKKETETEAEIARMEKEFAAEKEAFEKEFNIEVFCAKYGEDIPAEAEAVPAN
ncbi:MAG: hypothetical protein UX09_C0012G0018 [Candidatus Uhrbacteria bacterium GW2011_GWE2_45_35]|uniref:AAA+ ATPase domain-containing protein n=1 Tax=Candidatus Uhrbacteria bacterium GW2011_GWE2_45_35 TaxID=1618993 RepID=A0A0G1QJF8_9BACT|nr:MAG: hypothetical protein UX09_C0012G0018 [Candidatus Uhrbacteria bacterium GW2011_GWE2_45_35]